MIRIAAIYGTILGALYLCLNYITIIPFFAHRLDASAIGIYAILVSAIITLVGVNRYIFLKKDTGTYSYSRGLGTGFIINALGGLLFSAISIYILCCYGHCEGATSAFFTRFQQRLIVGVLVSALVPIAFKTKKE